MGSAHVVTMSRGKARSLAWKAHCRKIGLMAGQTMDILIEDWDALTCLSSEFFSSSASQNHIVIVMRIHSLGSV